MCTISRDQVDRPQSAKADTATAEQWAAILRVMHTLSTDDAAPIPATLIAQHAKMASADVERHLELMARVGLVHRVKRGSTRGWLLERPL
jgi:hypothetical protein